MDINTESLGMLIEKNDIKTIKEAFKDTENYRFLSFLFYRSLKNNKIDIIKAFTTKAEKQKNKRLNHLMTIESNNLNESIKFFFSSTYFLKLISSKNNMEEAISLACSNNHILLIKAFIKDEKFNKNDWLDAQCSASNQIDVIKLLHEKKHIKQRNYNDALYYACKEGNIEVVKFLAQQKETTFIDYDNRSISTAMTRNFHDIVNILFEKKEVRSTLKNEKPYLYERIVKNRVNTNLDNF